MVVFVRWRWRKVNVSSIYFDTAADSFRRQKYATSNTSRVQFRDSVLLSVGGCLCRKVVVVSSRTILLYAVGDILQSLVHQGRKVHRARDVCRISYHLYLEKSVQSSEARADRGTRQQGSVSVLNHRDTETMSIIKHLAWMERGFGLGNGQDRTERKRTE